MMMVGCWVVKRGSDIVGVVKDANQVDLLIAHKMSHYHDAITNYSRELHWFYML